MRICLDLPFKGSRTYLHSTDIFDALTTKLGVNSAVSLKISRFVHHPLVAIPASEVSDPHAYPVKFSGEALSGRVDLVLSEDTTRAVTRIVPYDENAIVADALLDGPTIRSTSHGGARAIERIVALNKRLISEVATPGKRLAFVSLAFSRTPNQDSLFVLKLESRLGTRLFRSSIEADGEPLGEIVFSGI